MKINEEISLEFSAVNEKLLHCARKLYWLGVERDVPGISFAGIDSEVEEELCDLEMGEDRVLPYIDFKHPYGDMTYFELDMPRVLGMILSANDAKFLKEEEQHLQKLHFEILPALHIFLRNAKMERGKFRHERFACPWERV